MCKCPSKYTHKHEFNNKNRFGNVYFFCSLLSSFICQIFMFDVQSWKATRTSVLTVCATGYRNCCVFSSINKQTISKRKHRVCCVLCVCDNAGCFVVVNIRWMVGHCSNSSTARSAQNEMPLHVSHQPTHTSQHSTAVTHSIVIIPLWSACNACILSDSLTAPISEQRR